MAEPRPGWLPALLLLSALAGCHCGPDPGASPTSGCGDEVFRAALALGKADAVGALAHLGAEPSCPRGELVRSLALVAQEKVEQARSQLAPVMASAGEDPRTALLAQELLAFELASGTAGDEAAAQEAVAKALQLDPASPRSLMLQALLRTDPVATRKDLQALAAARPPWTDPRDLYLKDLADWLLDILSDRKPLPATASRQAHDSLARLLAQLGEARTGTRRTELLRWALTEARQARANPPTAADAEVVVLEAGILDRMNDYPAEIELLRTQFSLSPNHPDVAVLLARTLNRVGRYQDTIALGKPRAEVCPACVLSLAEAYFRLGRAEAGPLLADLNGKKPGDGEVLSLLGRSLLQQGQLESGIQVLQEALRRSPSDMPALLELGPALTRAGKEDQAREVSERYRKLNEEQEQLDRRVEELGNVVSAYADARQRLERGDLPGAEESLRQVAERDPRFHLLPLLRIQLAVSRSQPPATEDVEAFLEAALARNTWLTVRR